MHIKVLATTPDELIASDSPLVHYFEIYKKGFETSEEFIEHIQDWFMQNSKYPNIYKRYQEQNRKPLVQFLDVDAVPNLEKDQIITEPKSISMQENIHEDIFEYAKMEEEDFIFLGNYYAYFDMGESRLKDLELAKERLVCDEPLDDEELVERLIEDGELPDLKENATDEEKKEYNQLIRRMLKEKYKEIDMWWFKA